MSRGGERRLVSVLFADLTGFTAYAEGMDPEDVHAFLQPVMDDLGTIVESYGGTVVNWMGDGLMAAFGVPIAHPDDAERAVRAAVACRDAVKSRNREASDRQSPASLHAGVHTGEVLVVNTPAGIDIIGDTVNTASRLVGVAPAGCVLVGAGTRDLTGHVATYLEWAPIRLKGKAEAVQAYQVTAIQETPGGRPTRAARTPFVGRGLELVWLGERMDRVIETGTSEVALIAGVPGVGKSRLLERFAQTEARAVHLVGRCRPYGERPPWYALAEAVRSAAGVPGGANAADAHGCLVASVAETLPAAAAAEQAAVTGWLGTMLGLEGSTVAVGAGPGQLNLDLAVAVRRFLGGIAARGPVVVVLEDVQWADPQLLAFLGWVRDEPWPGPVLFLCAAWPEVLDFDLKLDDTQVLRLGTLSEPDGTAMLADLLPGDVPPPLRESLLRRSGGNPLFLEEIVHLLRERGDLHEDRGRWILPAGAAAIPETVQLVVAGRLDTLPAEEVRLLRDASVSGERFWDRLLRALGWGPEQDELLERLVARDLIRLDAETSVAGAREYGFKHAVIRDVAYGTLPKAERAAKHLAIAGWLRASVFEGEEPVELLAFHYTQAVLLTGIHGGHTVRTAVEYQRKAGDRARRQFAWREAAGHYEQALEHGASLESGPQTAEGELLTEVRIAQAETFSRLSRYPEAREYAEEILSAAEAADRPDWRARALLTLGWIESDLSEVVRARALLEEAEGLLAAAGDPRGRAVALYELAFTYRYDDVEAQRTALEEAADAFRTVGDLRWELECLQTLAWLATPRGGDDFDRWYARLESLTEEAGDLRSRAVLRRAWGFFRYFAGDLEAARAALTEALELGRDVGDPDIGIESRLPLGAIALALGQPDEAKVHARRLIEAGQRRGFRRTEAQGILLRGRVRVARGDAGGWDDLDEAESILSGLGAMREMVEVWLARAEAGLESERLDEALENARRLGADLDRNGDRLWHPYALLLEGRALLASGDGDIARETLEQARTEARESGNVLVPARVEALLAG